MLSRTTIDQVNSLPLDQIISKYVDLKKHGATLSGKSPFQDENTPSFKVSLSKGIWKCLNTDKGEFTRQYSENKTIDFPLKVEGDK